MNENLDLNKPYPIPILIIAFKRPELVKKLMAKVLEINPGKIYIVHDGAREDFSKEDQQKWELTRSYI